MLMKGLKRELLDELVDCARGYVCEKRDKFAFTLNAVCKLKFDFEIVRAHCEPG